MAAFQEFYRSFLERFPAFFSSAGVAGGGVRAGFVIDHGDTESVSRSADQASLHTYPDTDPTNEVPPGALAIAARHWPSASQDPPSCDIVFDGKKELGATPQWMHVAQHEMTHCSMVDVLGPERYKQFIGRVMDEVPLDDLERWWAPRTDTRDPSSSHADARLSVEQEDAAYGTSECYARVKGLDIWSFTREDPATGAVHLDSAHLSGPYGHRLAAYVEEAVVALGAERDFARDPLPVPDMAPSGSGPMTRWTESLVHDIGALYAGTLTRDEFEARNAPVLTSAVASAVARPPPAAVPLQSDPIRDEFSCSASDPHGPVIAQQFVRPPPESVPALLAARDALRTEREKLVSRLDSFGDERRSDRDGSDRGVSGDGTRRGAGASAIGFSPPLTRGQRALSHPSADSIDLSAPERSRGDSSRSASAGVER